MKFHRLVLDIVMISTAIACTLALLTAVGGAAVDSVGQQAVTRSAEENQTYEGMVTCTRCGARHSAKIGESAADCARLCVHAGASFALVDGDKTYRLDGDLNLLKKVAGQRVRVVGLLSGTTIRIASLAAEG
jgi:hypothetical protein